MNIRSVMVLLAFCSALAPSQQKEIIAYYPSWKHGSGVALLPPERIPYDHLSILNYAFFFPRPDGSIAGRDSAGDALLLEPAATGTKLAALAHQSNVKVMLSIGGWEDSYNFPAVAADPNLRRRFVHSCVQHVTKFGFDGIDIDWEYPGEKTHNGTPADGPNFTLLLQALRDSLDSLGAHSARHYLLSAALPGDSAHAAALQMRSVAGILDFLNIMTYDFYGPWDPLANHNAPLHAGIGGDSARSLSGAFRLYHKTYRLPAGKINLGVPFYGHTYASCTAINTSHAGGDTVHFAPQGAFYADIAAKMKHFTRHWDEAAQVPYLVSTNWNMLVSYDDEQSVTAKARYVLDCGARGLIIWELTGDLMPDGTHPLLDALHRTFHDTR
ncbi:MAG TPA: glycosyl hydrolase family 18 protein [Bacteroidota bacterium]|nr:glycosyl hydrolase family 18 protein [Bacteroidota bacterium]